MRAGVARLKLRSERGEGKELGFWLVGNAFGTSMLFPHALLCSWSGWKVLMCGEGEGVGAFVKEVNAGGEVCWKVPGYWENCVYYQNYLSGTGASALHGGGQKVARENPTERVLTVRVEIRRRWRESGRFAAQVPNL